MSRPRRPILAVLVGFTIVVAGCGADGEHGGGGGNGGGDLQSVLATASETTTKASTAALDVTTEIDVDGETVSVDGEGSVDLGAKASEITTDVPGAGELTVRMVDGVMYMQSEMMGSELDGKSWARVDMERFSEEVTGESLSELSGGQGGADPGSMLESLQASTNVEEVGTEEIDGVSSTEYQADLDPEKMQNLSPEARQGLSSMMSKTGLSYEPMHVWISDDGLVRRMQVSLEIEVMTQTATSTVTVDYVDWGAEVSIEAPPADDTKDVTDDVIDELGD